MPIWNKSIPIKNAQDVPQDQPSIPLKVKGPKSVTLELVDGKIALPDFEIHPCDLKSPPQITSLSLGCDSDNAEFSQAVFEVYQHQPNSRQNLKRPMVVSGGTMEWRKDLPLDGSAQLLIKIEYKPVDGAGAYDSTECSVRASIRLLPGESLRPKRRLEVRPAHLLKVFEKSAHGRGPTLIVSLSANQGEGVNDFPSIRLRPVGIDVIAADWNCMHLNSAVDVMLASLGSPRIADEGGYVWQRVLQIELSPSDREQIFRRMESHPGEKLVIPISIEVDYASPYVLELEIQPKTSIHDTLVAVDLGNSTTTTVVKDSSVSDESEVPYEHFVAIRRTLFEFIEQPDPLIIQDGQSYWLNWLNEVCKSIELNPAGDPARALIDRFGSGIAGTANSERFYQTLKAIEIELWSLIPHEEDRDGRRLASFQSRVSNRLYRIYKTVFQRVPLKQWNIEIVRDNEEGNDYTLSELEILDIRPVPAGVIGGAVAKRRRQQLSGDVVLPLENGRILDGRFFDCPKRFLATIDDDRDLTVALGSKQPLPKLRRLALQTSAKSEQLGDKKETSKEELLGISSREIVQAAWDGVLNRKRVNYPALQAAQQVVLTYPADLRPESRERMDHAVRELGKTSVFLDFDESISPAIFHLEQLFGSFEELGCEAFKVQCLRSGNVWYHDMLVIDIGAGTTDVSIVRIELRETAPDTSRFGGRLYEITPRLLGAAGMDQTGGHQLTLAMFRVLKQILCSWLVGQLSDGTPHEICYENEESSTILKKALEACEQILPTRYREHSESSADDSAMDVAALKRFNGLWEWSERLKIELSELMVRMPEDFPTEMSIDAEGVIDEASDLLRQILGGTRYETIVSRSEAEGIPLPSISMIEFCKMAEASIEPSINMAINLAKAAVQSFRGSPGPSGVSSPQICQSVVLSGRACALPVLKNRLIKKLRDLNPSGKVPQILFRSEYAKTATAIGACRAQHRIASAFRRTGRPKQLEGKCEMDLKIQNLFFYLPCSYQLNDANNNFERVVFERHSQFVVQGRADKAIIRSLPAGRDAKLDTAEVFEEMQSEIRVYRNDGDQKKVKLSGLLPVEDLIKRADLEESETGRIRLESLGWRVRYEIDYLHHLTGLFIRPSIENGVAAYKVGFEALTPHEDPHLVIQANLKLSELLVDTHAFPPINCYLGSPEVGKPPFIDSEAWESIRVFGNDQPQGVAAWLSPIFATAVTHEGTINFGFVSAEDEQNNLVQSCTFKPSLVSANGLVFQQSYRLMLVQDGRICLVLGELPNYWETHSVAEWLASAPGRVLRHALPAPALPVDWWKDPFCGRH